MSQQVRATAAHEGTRTCVPVVEHIQQETLVEVAAINICPAVGFTCGPWDSTPVSNDRAVGIALRREAPQLPRRPAAVPTMGSIPRRFEDAEAVLVQP